MQDLETESLWSHILGECMEGELKGTRLEVIPSVMTDWKRWKEIEPETKAVLLSRTTDNYTNAFYRNLDKFVVGAIIGGKARHWTFDDLAERKGINDEFGGTPLWVTIETDGFGVHLFDRSIDGETISFNRQGDKWIDDETGSTWEPTTGVAIDGPMAGKEMQRLVSITSLTRAWNVFHPDSAEWRKDD